MEKFNLVAVQKKGNASMNKTTGALVGVLIAVILVVAFAPEIFGGIANLSSVSGVPSWVLTLAPILLGLMLIGVIAKAAGFKLF